jgi:pilus assembly protein CpaE
VTEPKLARLLEVARESYDAIVVDTSPFFHGPMLATLDRTDDLLLVSSLDVPTIKNVRLSLQTLELLSFPMKRVKVVLNRANSNVGLKRAEVEAALEIKVAFQVPSDRAIPVSVNRGSPAVISESNSEVARALRHMAESLLPAESAKAKRRWVPSLATAER